MNARMEELWIGRILQHWMTGEYARVESWPNKSEVRVLVQTGDHAGQTLDMDARAMQYDWDAIN